jgi:flavin-dependent dehydrogenase
MPSRQTKRGAERTPIDGSYDVIICGASFAGLAAARELAAARRPDGDPARVLLLDRYEIGERQTSACATPTAWLDELDLRPSLLQTFDSLVVHTPHSTVPVKLPWGFSTFDYPLLCSLLAEQGDAEFETATVTGCERPCGETFTVTTDRGELSAPLVVDALGWRRVLGSESFPPTESPLSRGLEVHPAGSSDRLELWVDRSIVPAGYGWSFPAAHEVRVGIGSFDPRFHVRQPTAKLAARVDRPADGFQGNWIPHRLRDATEHGVFFAGDSAGHCLPLTAEGIRTAFYFGIACGREIRGVLEGRASREQALQRYSAFSQLHERRFRWLLNIQRTLPKIPPRALALTAQALRSWRFIDWSFNHYLGVAHPDFAQRSRPQLAAGRREAEPLVAA